MSLEIVGGDLSIANWSYWILALRIRHLCLAGAQVSEAAGESTVQVVCNNGGPHQHVVSRPSLALRHSHRLIEDALAPFFYPPLLAGHSLTAKQSCPATPSQTEALDAVSRSSYQGSISIYQPRNTTIS